MRKDVKLAFVIGGILIAVLVVYVLVVPGGDQRPDRQAVQLQTQTDAPAPAVEEAAVAPAETEQPAEVADATPTIEETTPETQPTDPFASTATEEDKWMLALHQGTVPMMTAAPVPPTPDNPAAPTDARTQTESADSTDDTRIITNPQIVAPPTAGTSGSGSSIAPETALNTAPATQPVVNTSTDDTPPTNTGMRTHVVQKGESIAKIAEAVYGSQAYWPHIIRANPGIVAEKIRPGMTINLPADSEVKAGATPASHTQTATDNVQLQTTLDPKTQYEVQPNDSLHKIALKLYGNVNRWQAIYELNRETIGNDPGRLKARSILKLPEPPTQH